MLSAAMALLSRNRVLQIFKAPSNFSLRTRHLSQKTTYSAVQPRARDSDVNAVMQFKYPAQKLQTVNYYSASCEEK